MTNPTPEMPKFDKEEDKRERKGSGVPWLSKAGTGVARVGGPGGLAQVGGGFLRGGGGFFARLGAGLMAQPAVMLSLAGGIVLAGLVAWETGVMDSFINSDKKGSIFAKKDAGISAPDRADLHGGDRNSSLKYVAAPNAGAFNQADASASMGGDAAKDADKDKTDAAKDASQDAAGQAAPDPGSMAEQLAQKNRSGGFGKLSSGAGSLSGGAGMSGGVGRPFAPLSMAPKAGAVQAFARPGAVGRSAVAKRYVLASTRRNANLRKLDNMNRNIRPTVGMSSLPQASATQTEQWSSAQPGGQAITGAGANQGIAGGGGQSLDGGGASVGEGPIDTGNMNAPNAPEVPDTQDVTPWTGMLTAAKWMLMLASSIIFLIGLLSLMKNSMPELYIAIHSVQTYLYGIAAALAAAVTVMGIMLMTMYGQTTQGMILATAGGITTAAALVALFSPADYINPLAEWASVLGGIAGLGGSIMSMLMPGKMGPQ